MSDADTSVENQPLSWHMRGTLVALIRAKGHTLHGVSVALGRKPNWLGRKLVSKNRPVLVSEIDEVLAHIGVSVATFLDEVKNGQQT